mmetsp:Transcript_12757/g.11313  ORF Transcript_12757/g.11313 Transcript_12757/m.11313 type:complete len:103 (+) Transcript_12757:610-918(+)
MIVESQPTNYIKERKRERKSKRKTEEDKFELKSIKEPKTRFRNRRFNAQKTTEIAIRLPLNSVSRDELRNYYNRKEEGNITNPAPINEAREGYAIRTRSINL